MDDQHHKEGPYSTLLIPDMQTAIFSHLDTTSLLSMRLVSKKNLKFADAKNVLFKQRYEDPLLKYIHETNNLDAKIQSNSGVSNIYIGEFPLLLAIRINSIRCVSLLLEKGAKLSASDSSGDNPFHYAVKNGNVQILRLLAEREIAENPNSLLNGLNKLNNLGQPPIWHYSNIKSNTDNSNIAWLTNNLNKFLSRGTFEDYFEKYLSENGFMPFEQIAKIIKQQNIKQIRLNYHMIALILPSYSGENDKSKNRSILHWAVTTGNHEIVSLLLSMNGRVANTTDSTKIEKHKSIKEFITQKDTDGNTPLHLAAAMQDTKMAKLLVSQGAHQCINVTNNSGQTPLNIAKSSGNHVRKRKHLYSYQLRIFLVDEQKKTESKPNEATNSDTEISQSNHINTASKI